jgi:hypothetical protein
MTFRGGQHDARNQPQNVVRFYQHFGQPEQLMPSLTSTCKRHGIDPQHYLTQLLTNLPATPISQIEQWLADRWNGQNPSSA